MLLITIISKCGIRIKMIYNFSELVFKELWNKRGIVMK